MEPEGVTGVAKFLLTQGVLGVWALAATAAVVWLFRENRNLFQQLVAKSQTDASVNKATADKYHELLDAIVNKAKPRQRRSTVAGNE